MKVNVAGAELYRHVIQSNSIKSDFESSINWDLDAIAKTMRSMRRIGELAVADKLTLTAEEDDYEKGLFDIAESRCIVNEYLADINLYCHNGTSNSYTANYLLNKLSSDSKGIWIRPDLKAVVINEITSDTANYALDLTEKLNVQELGQLNKLLVEIKALADVRDQTKKELESAIARAENQMVVAIMMDKISINFDAIEVIKADVPSRDFTTTEIKQLPGAVDYIGLYRNPRAFLSEGSQITIAGNPPTVTLIVDTPATIWQGFNHSNIEGLNAEQKDDATKFVCDAFTQQVLMDANITPHEADKIIRDCVPSVCQSFACAYKVLASENVVVVTPYGDDQTVVAKQVAVHILEKLRDSMPSVYQELNETLQAVYVSTGDIDPRVALAIASTIDDRASTVYSNYPISKNIVEKINLFEEVRQSIFPAQKNQVNQPSFSF